MSHIGPSPTSPELTAESAMQAKADPSRSRVYFRLDPSLTWVSTARLVANLLRASIKVFL